MTFSVKYQHIYVHLWLIQEYLLSYLQVVFTIMFNCYYTIAKIRRALGKLYIPYGLQTLVITQD